MSNEGKTPLDDLSGLLVPATNMEELNAFEFANINKAIQKYLLKTPSDKQAPFSYPWFFKVHKEMLGEVWSWAGQIRKSNKSIGIDKSQILEALKNLEHDFFYWLKTMDPNEIAARLHHRLVWVHPFENGNGRWSRLITNIYFKKNALPLIHWPEKSLLEKTDTRKKYLQALREADNQNFEPLIKLHQEFQK
ncbi:MAG: mobile mystery protein B [Deltaproteobacteria bacterium]|nr:mobile mystery protein B [Deltaproteobacteria bacterium]